jgi:hypothetical protein
MLPSFFDRMGDAIAGLADGLCDPARRRRVALALAIGYGVVWMIYGVIAKSSQDVNVDMAEMVIWAREPALGYPKHPPLLAYVVRLWFAIFPEADWAFMLLAVTTASAGIFLAFELCGTWLDGEKRAATPFLLATIPFYNFLALKFDQNSALIPLWALAMLALIRSIETRKAGWAALTGLAAAAAMLTKYWSGFLLVALALTALADRRRLTYLRSSAPWLTALVFIAAMLPHAIWLVREDFPPLAWVTSRRVAASGDEFLHSLGAISAARSVMRRRRCLSARFCYDRRSAPYVRPGSRSSRNAAPRQCFSGRRSSVHLSLRLHCRSTFWRYGMRLPTICCRS